MRSINDFYDNNYRIKKPSRILNDDRINKAYLNKWHWKVFGTIAIGYVIIACLVHLL